MHHSRPLVLVSFVCAAFLGIGAVILPVWLLSLRSYPAPVFPLIRPALRACRISRLSMGGRSSFSHAPHPFPHLLGDSCTLLEWVCDCSPCQLPDGGEAPRAESAPRKLHNTGGHPEGHKRLRRPLRRSAHYRCARYGTRMHGVFVRSSSIRCKRRLAVHLACDPSPKRIRGGA